MAAADEELPNFDEQDQKEEQKENKEESGDAKKVLIGAPGRVLATLREKDVQQILTETPEKKFVMMFSVTMTSEIHTLCKKYMQDLYEIRVDAELKLILHGLLPCFVKLSKEGKNRKLNDLLDTLEFYQVVTFVQSVQCASALDKLPVKCNFPSIAIHFGLKQEERIARHKQFKELQKRILVSTDLFGRGFDILKRVRGS